MGERSDTTAGERVPALLVYNGEVIHDRHEMVSLTDMWKAAGRPDGRGPSDWLALASTKEFRAAVEATLVAEKSGIQTSRGGRGVGGATWGHWQMALAYAKYLSAEFHMWCNTVVRERMQSGSQFGLSRDTAELIRRTDGISRQLSHKVTEIEKAVPCLVESIAVLAQRVNCLMIAADPRVAVLDYISVRELLIEAKAFQKGRGAINRRIGREMMMRAALSPERNVTRRCPHSGVWLYHRDFAAAYMRERGDRLVGDHNDHVLGQGVIKFPARAA